MEDELMGLVMQMSAAKPAISGSKAREVATDMTAFAARSKGAAYIAFVLQHDGIAASGLGVSTANVDAFEQALRDWLDNRASILKTGVDPRDA